MNLQRSTTGQQVGVLVAGAYIRADKNDSYTVTTMSLQIDAEIEER